MESPWSKREENLIRDVFTRVYASDEERAKAITDEVERIGIEPFQAPDPLLPILPDHVHLICWMAIDADAVQRGKPRCRITLHTRLSPGSSHDIRTRQQYAVGSP